MLHQLTYTKEYCTVRIKKEESHISSTPMMGPTTSMEKGISQLDKLATKRSELSVVQLRNPISNDKLRFELKKLQFIYIDILSLTRL